MTDKLISLADPAKDGEATCNDCLQVRAAKEAEIEALRERVKALEEGLSYMSRVYDAETDSEDTLLPVLEGSMVFSVASARALLAPATGEAGK